MAEDDETSRLGCTDCERIRSGRIAQPVNTATSLGLVAAGGAIATVVRRKSGGRDAEVLAYGALVALTGLGSVAFHGPQPRGARVMHDAPIAAVLALTAITPAVRRLRGLTAVPGWSGRRGVALAAIAAAAGAAYAGGRTAAPTCRPDSVLQLHGAWHLLTATAFTVTAAILYEPAARS